METYTLSAFPSTYSTIHIALFRNVTNAPEIRKRLIRASTLEGDLGDRARAEVDFGFIEASLVAPSSSTSTSTSYPSSPSTPTTSSSNTQNPSNSPLTPTPTPPTIPTPTVQPQTRSHNLHSEVLLSLSPNNNITDSIRRHGISDSTSFLAVIRFGPRTTPPEEVYQAMKVVVDGQLVSLDELGQGDNLDRIKVDKVCFCLVLSSILFNFAHSVLFVHFFLFVHSCSFLFYLFYLFCLFICYHQQIGRT
ncbi:kinase binding protein CGI-121-domain-containing protein [Naematelia encephala]|uniref:EKC/KEOPS complex subunit CGI121 n=1 Tax=Naematelia encephala TaxID=71784 RepID=A0A1Y2ADE1_9TREE|nr:kinase binding protein CGI-121-domain-containing protein [Naematelia encephala]